MGRNGVGVLFEGEIKSTNSRLTGLAAQTVKYKPGFGVQHYNNIYSTHPSRARPFWSTAPGPE